MWFLIFVCVSMVCGVPIKNPPQDDVAAATDNVIAVQEKIPAESKGVNVSVEQNAETLEEFQDHIVQEGDILMPEDRNAVETLWLAGIVPYEISSELANREWEIQTALKMISDVTCIRFRKHTNEPNYVVFKDGRGCASYVGCRGGDQPIFFAPHCAVGNLCHEIIHALGLHHEHTRKDREDFISVQKQNIVPGRENNFKVKEGETLNLPYDVNSIMHYGQFFFSKNGLPTLVSKQSGEEMGQRKHLSPLDIKRLNKLYHCD
ncbi:high choriolytic enzyme 1-like [Solea senegalensis]|uniref:High choriolytic enzyme 1-like n=1 Tax=Solea senegalensis TaxID=28829 RepID=A0AAV6RU71_SOLSE|nr:zinc metalloproteinase nas-14-like [Solea senegalensis]KAG7509047.1 high choriolytic enzyme 1-like [Solea senegalensis]